MGFRVFIILLILLIVDIYVFQGIRFLLQQKSFSTQRIVSWIFWSVTLISFGIIITGQYIDWHTWPKAFRTYAFASIVIVYASKLFVVLFLLVDDVLRLIRWIGNYVNNTFFNSTKETTGEAVRISRYKFLVQAGFVIASIPFLSLIWGMWRGAYNYTVSNVKLKFPNLPPEFNGLRVVQISDIHSGSFNSDQPLQEAVNLIMKQKADLILFTGDLVNDLHTEAKQYSHVFKQLSAPLGVYSVLGNHDYGDYYFRDASQRAAREENLHQLKELQKSFGWKLLLNEHAVIEKNGASIGVVGVENWSSHRSFPKYGDMTKAMEGMPDTTFNILMSHDPSHWNSQVTEQYKNMDLTLSGHTHGFQFGIEIPGIKWSPVQYVYKEWADLYQQGQQYLYVNRGLGFLGYPGRVGIMPEITVFELNSNA